MYERPYNKVLSSVAPQARDLHEARLAAGADYANPTRQVLAIADVGERPGSREALQLYAAPPDGTKGGSLSIDRSTVQSGIERVRSSLALPSGGFVLKC